jgi:hypothetical protein
MGLLFSRRAVKTVRSISLMGGLWLLGRQLKR